MRKTFLSSALLYLQTHFVLQHDVRLSKHYGPLRLTKESTYCNIFLIWTFMCTNPLKHFVLLLLYDFNQFSHRWRDLWMSVFGPAWLSTQHWNKLNCYWLTSTFLSLFAGQPAGRLPLESVGLSSVAQLAVLAAFLLARAVARPACHRCRRHCDHRWRRCGAVLEWRHLLPAAAGTDQRTAASVRAVQHGKCACAWCDCQGAL